MAALAIKSLNTLLRTIKEHFENTSDFTGGEIKSTDMDRLMF